MTGKALRTSHLVAATPTAQLEADRMAVAIRLGGAVAEAPSGMPYPGVPFADVVAAANPRKRQRMRAKPPAGDA
jgi:hypothetical protein